MNDRKVVGYEVSMVTGLVALNHIRSRLDHRGGYKADLSVFKKINHISYVL